MAKYCDLCRQSYSVEYNSCPFCDASQPQDRARVRNPLPNGDPTPLPVGAGLSVQPNVPARAGRIESRAESSDRRENGAISPIGPRSSARALLGPGSGGDDSAGDESDASIDLGSPVQGGNRGADSGPPSGASFVSWTALINNRKDFDDDPLERAESPKQPAPPAVSARSMLGNNSPTAAAKSATNLKPTARRTSPWFYVAALVIGVVLAFLVKVLR